MAEPLLCKPCDEPLFARRPVSHSISLEPSDADHNAHYLIRGRLDSTFRRTATAVLHRAALAHKSSVTSAIIAKMIRSIQSSLLLSLIVWPALFFGIRSAGPAYRNHAS